ncbi:MAG TPA: hypothetical protein VHW68_04665 [Actinomycetota bacterium]|nr:hypothetical protein [Actinomycetota bacterium]
MSVRGVSWYVAAFVVLIVAAVFIGVAAASFFASLTPLYVSILCSVVAVAFGVVSAVRARPSDAPLQDEDAEAAVEEESVDAEEPTDAASPADAAHPGDGE